MDITFISDTHGLHDSLKLQRGTVLIHAGDITEYGTEEEVKDFLKWFSNQPFTYKVFIAGNHDLFFQDCLVLKRDKLIPGGIIYLQNSFLEIENRKFWGSPVTPYFLGMAFNVRAGMDIKKVWDKIPGDTDVLITHGPPKGVLDNGIGCEELWKRVNIVKPSIHCFGHAHGFSGVDEKNGIRFVNAAMVDGLDLLKSDVYKVVGKAVRLVI
ncbi:MAG: metallophosphatase domain-containing protein [Chitinophagaceae bacterium]